MENGIVRWLRDYQALAFAAEALASGHTPSQAAKRGRELAAEMDDEIRSCAEGIVAMYEVCDLLDNDCDGMIDEGLGLGDACGSDIFEER